MGKQPPNNPRTVVPEGRGARHSTCRAGTRGSAARRRTSSHVPRGPRLSPPAAQRGPAERRGGPRRRPFPGGGLKAGAPTIKEIGIEEAPAGTRSSPENGARPSRGVRGVRPVLTARRAPTRTARGRPAVTMGIPTGAALPRDRASRQPRGRRAGLQLPTYTAPRARSAPWRPNRR